MPKLFPQTYASFDIQHNAHSHGLIDHVIDLDDLFLAEK
jgi:hypothetical protein